MRRGLLLGPRPLDRVQLKARLRHSAGGLKRSVAFGAQRLDLAVHFVDELAGLLEAAFELRFQPVEDLFLLRSHLRRETPARGLVRPLKLFHRLADLFLGVRNGGVRRPACLPFDFRVPFA